MMKLGVSHINLWSLDCEGCEEVALSTFDFAAVPVQHMVVELDRHDEERNERVIGILRSAGFQKEECNLFATGCFTNTKFPEHLKAPRGQTEDTKLSTILARYVLHGYNKLLA